MAKKSQKGADSSSNQSFAMFWILILSGLGIVFIPPTMLVLIAGMIPSFVALLLNTDRTAGLAAMLAFNLAGVIPVIGILWERGQTFHEAFRILSDVYMWLAMLGGAGIAVFLAWAIPIVVFAAYDLQAKATLVRLQKQRSKLIEEWGGQFVSDVKDLDQKQ
ncbi:hypothetical protein J0X12_07450 [Sneathiella sp. CAU 1612]|jgi:hypothetical protein|uniref:DUF2062 domain-containing protein n=1 Tax=Sneathiella sedimenti TaxID=2816034 RepID=A0ABS3F4I0_9PROT|nr:hypothetical protein [Sneathiella sedimenti]MBO0333442.1 hypothetical protein [Sneathiella sedimenti]